MQYRSAVFYRTEEERAAAQASKARLEERVGRITTSIEPLPRFYRAEDYHQKYYLRGQRKLMSDFRALFPDDRRFVDSTAAARVNGWLEGCGSPAGISRDLPRLGLSDSAVDELRSRVLRASR